MVINTLQGHPQTQTFGVKLDFELIMSAIRNPDLRTAHPKIVAVFIELLKGTYIEFGL